MKVNTQTFKDFFSLTKGMKPNTILPIYSYIKLSPGILEKSNGGVHCRFKFDCDEKFEPILLEELEVLSILKDTSSDVIEITPTTMKAGRIKSSFPVADAKDFPAFPDGEGNLTTFDGRVFAIAANYVDPKNVGWMQYVVSDSNGVLGTDSFTIFYHNTTAPNMVLSTECCKILGDLGEVSHYSTGNTDFFITDDVQFGFTQTSFNVPPYMSVVNKIEAGNITVKKSDLLLFCDTTTPRSEKPCVIKDGGDGKLLLQLLDNDKGKTNELVIDVEKADTAPDFKFYPKLLSSLLRPLPYEMLTIHIGQHLSFTTPEDEKYKGILSQLINL